MRRSNAFLVVVVLSAAACSDGPTSPPVPAGSMAPAEEVEAYVPAIHDVRDRILPAGGADGAALRRLEGHLVELELAFERRDVVGTAAAIEGARDALGDCSDACLVAPERGVVDVTLLRASSLIDP